jgi:ATP-dependent Clp protease adaptor protein ClpS
MMPDQPDSGTTTEEQTGVTTEKEPKDKLLPPYNVVLLDDDDHTYDYVIEMLMKLFGHSAEQAFLMAREVDNTGRVIVDTTTKERAEFKQEQIHAYGPDWRLERCSGSMSAIIEPAPG